MASAKISCCETASNSVMPDRNFHVVRRAKNIGYGLSACRQTEARAFDQARSEKVMLQVTDGPARAPSAKRCAVALKPGPAICGKMNHIQCARFRPRDSSATTCR
jgi:hypothetical protein